MSLYLKYRPPTLDSIIGNEDVVSIIQTMIASNTLPHTILLTGATGCGKTTVARIIASALGCTGIDFREVNTADFRGIDTARDIIKQSSFMPMESKCRVWLIDECHKLTTDAQNALLKILEDTPKHVYFILCTTDPQSLIATIKGRCNVFQMSALNDKQMFTLLRTVVANEKQTLAKLVYEQIILDSLGLPRNALQILEQVLQSPADKRLEIAKRTAEEQSQSIQLCRALIAHSSWKEISTILTGLKTQDAEGIRRHLLAYAQSVLLSKENNRAALIIEELLQPLYNVGFPGLVYACYSITKN